MSAVLLPTNIIRQHTTKIIMFELVSTGEKTCQTFPKKAVVFKHIHKSEKIFACKITGVNLLFIDWHRR